MNHNFDFQGCQKMHIRVAISQKGLIGLFANWCHLMLLGPKEWKHKSKVLRTHFKNFFIPGTLCPLLGCIDLWSISFPIKHPSAVPCCDLGNTGNTKISHLVVAEKTGNIVEQN